jgi:5-methylcytosine-specific restriction endonuclease McrA
MKIYLKEKCGEWRLFEGNLTTELTKRNIIIGEGARIGEWARKARASLMEHLGMKCQECGATDHLTLDTPFPTGDSHHRLDMARRTSFYRRMHLVGNLCILCETCNARKGNQYDQPFYENNHFDPNL